MCFNLTCRNRTAWETLSVPLSVYNTSSDFISANITKTMSSSLWNIISSLHSIHPITASSKDISVVQFQTIFATQSLIRPSKCTKYVTITKILPCQSISTQCSAVTCPTSQPWTDTNIKHATLISTAAMVIIILIITLIWKSKR